MKPPKNHAMFALLAVLALLATSCGRSTKFSTVLEGGFDPVATFRQQGYIIQTEARGESIRNAEYGYGWQSWCGVLTGAEKRPDCAAIAVLIRDTLNKTLGAGSLDELTVGAGHSEADPLTGMLRYNKDSVHGDMYVWLMPNRTNAAVSYVIFVREERLK